MNPLGKPLVGSALILAASTLTHAQIITWHGATDISGPSDIATKGLYVDALQTHDYKGSYPSGAGSLVPISITNPTTGKSTEFNVYTSAGSTGSSPGNFYADKTFSITADGDTGSDGSNSDATPYQQILDGSTYANYPAQTPTEAGTVTINGLIAGDSYQLQVWASAGYRPTTYTSGSNSVNLNYALPPSTASYPNGQYVLGTFTATGSTDSFTYQNTYPIDVSAGEINAIALRDLSKTPDPSTYALLLSGLAVLGYCVRRKNASLRA